MQQQIRAQKVCSLTLRSIIQAAEWGRQRCTPPFLSLPLSLSPSFYSAGFFFYCCEKLRTSEIYWFFFYHYAYCFSTCTLLILYHHNSWREAPEMLLDPLVAPFSGPAGLLSLLVLPLRTYTAVFSGLWLLQHHSMYCLAEAWSSPKSITGAQTHTHTLSRQAQGHSAQWFLLTSLYHLYHVTLRLNYIAGVP